MSQELKNFTKSIADAIRTKKKTTNLINPQDFPSEISSIQTEPNLTTKEITANGTYNASDDGVDGYSSVDVSVGVTDSNFNLFNVNEFEFDENVCTNFKGNEYLGGLLNGCTIPSSYSIVNGEYVAGSDYKVTAIRGAEEKENGGYSTTRFTGYDYIEIPTSVLEIQGGCFNESSLKRIKISGENVKANCNRLFRNCSNLLEVDTNKLDTSNTTSMRVMFQNCENLTSLDVSNFDTSNVTDMSYMFNMCKLLVSLNLLNFDTRKVTSMAYMFQTCTDLTSLDLSSFDTSNVTDMKYMFYNCYYLTPSALSSFDTRNVTDMAYMFCQCYYLPTIPSLDTRNVTIMEGMFYLCSRLTTIPLLDMRSVNRADSMFNGCSALTNLTLKNVRVSLQIGSGTSWGHLLTLDSLLNTIKELWINTGTSTLTLTMGTANTAKLADVYVKLIDITDEMRAEDEYIDNKAPFEVCESTDEGAMLITEYVTTVKNWALA